MKRIATLSITIAILTLGLAVPALAATPIAAVNPPSGEQGTAVVVNIAGFTPNSTFEVHGEALDGPLLRSGLTSGSGEGSVGVTIPSNAAEGAYTLAICETSFVACTDTWSDFWVGTTVIFTVSPPPPTTTGIPFVVLGPDSGEAGTSTTVTISGFTPGSAFEIHIADYAADPLVAGFTDTIGEAELDIEIPHGAAAGTLTIGVCETSFVACTDTWSDFWVGASAPFTVMTPPPPPTTTTTTVAPTTTTTTVAASPTTTVAPDVTTTTLGPLVDDDSTTALPITEEPGTGTGSNLWWLIVIALGGALIWFLLVWTLRSED